MSTDFETRPADWLAVAEAQSRILDNVEPTASVVVPLTEALGLALAEERRARTTLPAWDNSAMDGYAVRGADIHGAAPSRPRALRVVARVMAGEAPTVGVGAGEAVRIMTGAPLPPGADTVVRIEDTDAEAGAGTVRVLADRDRNRNVRPAGQDMEAGAPVLSAGDTVRPGTVAVLAALGLTKVSVHAPPRVAVLPTGDELRTPDRYDDVIAGRGVPESNGPMLAAQIEGARARAELLDIAPDDGGAIERHVREASAADVLVTVGGASMGEADLLKRVLDGMGFELAFWRVRMRPGSPFSFGWLPRGGRPQPVFGLPGNPASAFVTFELFVRPFLLRLSGHRRVFRRILRCVAGEDLVGPPDLAHYVRVQMRTDEWPPVVTATGPQSSGLVRSLPAADGLAVIPEDDDGVPAGEAVEVILLDEAPVAVSHRGVGTG